MIEQTRPLLPADTPELAAVLTAGGLAAAYAHGHLRALGLAEGRVRAWGWPAHGPLRAALVARDGIAWVACPEEAAVAALAARLGRGNVQLLSGPPAATTPLLAALPPGCNAGQDRCPLAVLTPDGFRPPIGPARRATSADMEALIDFYRHGFYSLAALPTRAAWRARLAEQLTYRTTYVVEHAGRVVASAQSSAETPTWAMIGGVATLPAYRNQGLSGACVGALCAALFAAGAQHIGLFWMPGNTPAAHVYARLGFQPAGEWWLTRLVPGFPG